MIFKEAMHREQLLEQKLERLQNVIRDTQQTSDDTWQAILHEDRLLGRINVLEDQLRIYRTKVEKVISHYYQEILLFFFS